MGPAGALVLGLLLSSLSCLPTSPLYFLPLSFRSHAVHGIWIRGIQEARAGPEGSQAAPGKVGFQLRYPEALDR